MLLSFLYQPKKGMFETGLEQIAIKRPSNVSCNLDVDDASVEVIVPQDTLVELNFTLFDLGYIKYLLEQFKDELTIGKITTPAADWEVGDTIYVAEEDPAEAGKGVFPAEPKFETNWWRATGTGHAFTVELTAEQIAKLDAKKQDPVSTALVIEDDDTSDNYGKVVIGAGGDPLFGDAVVKNFWRGKALIDAGTYTLGDDDATIGSFTTDGKVLTDAGWKANADITEGTNKVYFGIYDDASGVTTYGDGIAITVGEWQEATDVEVNFWAKEKLFIKTEPKTDINLKLETRERNIFPNLKYKGEAYDATAKCLMATYEVELHDDITDETKVLFRAPKAPWSK